MRSIRSTPICGSLSFTRIILEVCPLNEPHLFFLPSPLVKGNTSTCVIGSAVPRFGVLGVVTPRAIRQTALATRAYYHRVYGDWYPALEADGPVVQGQCSL